jgi:hypothetical protein
MAQAVNSVIEAVPTSGTAAAKTKISTLVPNERSFRSDRRPTSTR